MTESADLRTVDAWWRAANYLSVGQIYLRDNPLARGGLDPEQIKPRLLGHWGTSPGLNLLWAHLNRVIREREAEVLFVCGPGHGGPAMVANAWLEGTYAELFPAVSEDEEGMKRLFRQFSYPGGIPSHAAPETPGSINEGGELGYSLMHAYGAALDNPGLVAACVIGDGEAETGPLATSWFGNMFLDPVTDGAVLPILHLNGYKIANPTVLSHIDEEDLTALLRGYGYEPIVVAGQDEDPAGIHVPLAAAMDRAFDAIRDIQSAARAGEGPVRPRWPMIVLRTPKGWTGPRSVDGQQVEGTFHAHQVPLPGVREDPAHRELLERWLASYRPEELFPDGGISAELRSLRPAPALRMSASPHANGGMVAPLDLPETTRHEVEADRTGEAEGTRVLGGWLAEVMRRNPEDFRLFGPDEVVSNRLDGVFEVTERAWAGGTVPTDEHLARRGRVIEMLSEHMMQGMLEGYLLTGRHGLLTSYEAFVHIVDSMFNQHAKWLESAAKVPWRGRVASFTYLLSSHVWRQDHNGFSHQDPGFLNVVVNKQADVVRVYLPPDANTLLATMRHALGTSGRVNVVVAGKQPQPAWLTGEQARAHVEAGIGAWGWAGSEPRGAGSPAGGEDAADAGEEPDVVLACAGDVPTYETVAAAQLLREEAPELSVRVVNVVDLFRLQSSSLHPHGLDDAAFDALFTRSSPVIFAFHGYPSLVHQLTYRRANDAGIHVHGFQELGTTTTPFDMVRLNGLDRYALALDALRRVPDADARHPGLAERWEQAREDARAHAYEHGEDPDFVTGWRFRPAGD
ncbi:phosphoketolase [Rothia halotolerans]|uniref:phosphoketolase family protein n=1 Tax=Rothia halotolerans TaxID=405770 RepID=UPI00101CFF9F|nr:phosphoketolase family protein [Rothia halotolerans]